MIVTVRPCCLLHHVGSGPLKKKISIKLIVTGWHPAVSRQKPLATAYPGCPSILVWTVADFDCRKYPTRLDVIEMETHDRETSRIQVDRNRDCTVLFRDIHNYRCCHATHRDNSDLLQIILAECRDGSALSAVMGQHGPAEALKCVHIFILE